MAYRIGITFLSFGTDVFAGIENSLYNLALGLRQNGVEVAVFSGLLSGSETEIDGIPIFRSLLLPTTLPEGDHTVRVAIGRNRHGLLAEIKEFINKYDLSHLYVCDPLWGIVQTSEAWRYFSIPVILSLRVPNTIELLEEAARVPYLFRTATSISLKGELESLVHFPEEIVVLPNSINCDLFRPGDSPARQLDSPVIFCNCRISPEKGIEYLISALVVVAKRFPCIRLQLCGGDYPFGDKSTYLRHVLNRVEEAGIAHRIEMLPNLNWSSIPELIRSASLVVLPSLRETFGRAALEALACGTPLVCSDVGNLSALTEGVAYLVPPADANALAEAIIGVLENPDSRRRIAAQGVMIAERYSNLNVARQLMNEITRLESQKRLPNF